MWKNQREDIYQHFKASIPPPPPPPTPITIIFGLLISYDACRFFPCKWQFFILYKWAIKVNVQGSLTMGASEMLWPLEQGFHEAVWSPIHPSLFGHFKEDEMIFTLYPQVLCLLMFPFPTKNCNLRKWYIFHKQSFNHYKSKVKWHDGVNPLIMGDCCQYK